MKEIIKDKKILFAFFLLVIMVAFLCQYVIQYGKAETDTFVSIPQLAVDVKGAVHAPDVYFFERGATVQDAIDAAGGITENGSLETLDGSALLYDEQMLVVPVQGEATEDDRLNLNTATKEELMELPQIGAATADKIIAYRTDKGFSKPEDIKNVNGIGNKKYEQIKEYICVK